MKYLSLFTGIGGFELGINQAYENISAKKEKERIREGSSETIRAGKIIYQDEGYTGLGDSGAESQQHPIVGSDRQPHCVGYSEIDKYASTIYQSHFPEHKNYGDITKINEKELPDFDLLVGGFPCQSFSIAGKRGGFTDTRGTLFFDIARILKHKQPHLLLLENVKGLLSHDEGRTFATIISTLDELGYDLQWQVLNSKDFGVPQNRERVFIVGHLRGTPRPEVFPLEGQSNENTTISKSAKTAVARTLTGGGNTGGNHSGMTILQVNDPIHSNDRVYDPDGLSPTLNTMQGGLRQPFVVAQRGRYINNPKSRIAGLPTKQILEPNLKGISNTLSTVQKDNMLCDTNMKIRRLTPIECERLQGFPDGWTEGVSDSQRYKCLGNAVTVNVIQAIIGKLLTK